MKKTIFTAALIAALALTGCSGNSTPETIPETTEAATEEEEALIEEEESGPFFAELAQTRQPNLKSDFADLADHITITIDGKDLTFGEFTFNDIPGEPATRMLTEEDLEMNYFLDDGRILCESHEEIDMYSDINDAVVDQLVIYGGTWTINGVEYDLDEKNVLASDIIKDSDIPMFLYIYQNDGDYRIAFETSNGSIAGISVCCSTDYGYMDSNFDYEDSSITYRGDMLMVQDLAILAEQLGDLDDSVITYDGGMVIDYGSYLYFTETTDEDLLCFGNVYPGAAVPDIVDEFGLDGSFLELDVMTFEENGIYVCAMCDDGDIASVYVYVFR